MSTIIAFVASYFVLLIILSEVVRPKRRRLATLAGELLCLDLPLETEHAIKSMLATANSIRAAPLTLLSFTIGLFTPSRKIDRLSCEWAKKNPEVVGDPRWSELYDLYYLSITAENPIFGALLYAARLLFRVKAYLFVIRHYRPTRHQLADLSVKPKVAVRPRVAEIEIFGEMKATVAA